MKVPTKWHFFLGGCAFLYFFMGQSSVMKSLRNQLYVIFGLNLPLIGRVAKVVREHGWHPPKSLDLDENVKPEHTLFCAN